MTSTRYPHIVFDLDGTLVDSRRDLADAANALVARYGGPPLAVEAVVQMVGEGVRVLVARALEAAGVSAPLDRAVDTFLEAYEARLTAHTRPYDGIVPLFDRLAATRRLSILTNKPGRATERLLAALDLARYFDHVVAGDDRFGRKPSPEGLAYLVAEGGTAPGDTLLVGDSWVDLETARAAGTGVCLARYGFGFLRIPPEDLAGVPVIDRPGELLDRLEAAAAADMAWR